MNTRVASDIEHHVVVDCPLCDGPATVDWTGMSLDCPACAVRLEIAPDDAPALPAAA